MNRSLNYLLVFPIVVLTSFVACSAVNAQQRAPMGKLPFRSKPDGSVDFRDLLELTKQAPAKDRITDAELQVIKDRHKIDYGKEFKPVGEGERTMPARGDYYANSTLLTDGANHTILPKEAVICLPEKFQNRKIEEARGRLILWPDFIKENRRWIRTQEVSLKTALGEEPLSEEKMTALRSTGLVIVGVMRGSPISVLPPKEDTDLESAPPTENIPNSTSKYRTSNTKQQNSAFNRLSKK